MQNLVNVQHQNGIAVLLLNNPPVNAIGFELTHALAAALSEAGNDASVDAVVLIGGGRTFIAGADIKVLEALAHGGRDRLDLRPLLRQIEDFPKPVVAAIHGNALGGGLELAMAAHYRVASPDARMGQPEVNLGIIPGAEGTQRLPRLVGLKAAVDLCVTGKPIGAKEAAGLGLVDAVIDGDLLQGAAAFARQAAQRGTHPKTRERVDKLAAPPEAGPILAAGRDLARKIRRNMQAPLAAIDALEAAAALPFEEGSLKERALSEQTLASGEARASMHAFFAERAVSKIPDLPKDAPARPIRSCAIVGAGTMGAGIAMAMANAGISVRLKDETADALDRAMANIRKNYDVSVKRGRFTAEAVEERIALIHPQADTRGFESADLVLEAVFETMPLKKKVFAEIDAIAGPDAILASNTSTLDIDEIASATRRPGMVAGLHFFSPANIMRLVEIVRGRSTKPEVLATALGLAKTLGKVGVVVGNCRGFVGNRMMFPYMREAQFLVEEGAAPWDVDQALYDFGMAMGIFAVDDLGGIDIMWRIRQESRHLVEPGTRQPLMTDRLYELGRLGQKTGAGWYRYGDDRKPVRDPLVEELIRSTAETAGIPRRSIGREEILERCLYSMINEGAKILEEGHALRAGDIDTIYISGYGFPAYRGGPMWYADTVGLQRILDRIRQFEREHGKAWTPAPLLERLAAEGRTFAQLDAAVEERHGSR